MSFTKTSLIDHITEQTGFARRDVETVTTEFLNTVTTALAEGEEVVLRGFGTFTTLGRAATVGRNPRTGETIKLPAKKVPKFKPGVDLKQAVAQA